MLSLNRSVSLCRPGDNQDLRALNLASTDKGRLYVCECTMIFVCTQYKKALFPNTSFYIFDRVNNTTIPTFVTFFVRSTPQSCLLTEQSRSMLDHIAQHNIPNEEVHNNAQK